MQIEELFAFPGFKAKNLILNQVQLRKTINASTNLNWNGNSLCKVNVYWLAFLLFPETTLFNLNSDKLIFVQQFRANSLE